MEKSKPLEGQFTGNKKGLSADLQSGSRGQASGRTRSKKIRDKTVFKEEPGVREPWS